MPHRLLTPASGRFARTEILAVRILAALSLIILPSRADEEKPWFEEIPSERSGLDFRFESGSRDTFDLPEIMGGGFAVADFDADGLPDLFFCQGGPISTATRQGGDHDLEVIARDAPCVWYRNLGRMRFQRVATGPAGPAYAMGAWPADFDGDGRMDLFVTGWRGWSLYRNQGGWKFENRTTMLGPNPANWSTAAVWCDFDRDGHPDLFVGGYLEYDPEKAPYCAAPDGRRDYCGPEDFPAVANRLFVNDGQGGFTDESRRLGPSRSTGRTLAAIGTDVNGDGAPDLFVANDGTACELLIQNDDGTFRDDAVERGVALDGTGNALAAMGIALERDHESTNLFVTNFFGRGTVHFRSSHGAIFRDVSTETGLRKATDRFNGFGLAVADFDGDGSNEIVQANGHVLSRERLGTPFAMPAVLLAKNRSGKYEPAAPGLFPVADRKILGRGLAVVDFDGDSKPDILISRLDGNPILLRNMTPRSDRRITNSRRRWSGGSYLTGVETLGPEVRTP